MGDIEKDVEQLKLIIEKGQKDRYAPIYEITHLGFSEEEIKDPFCIRKCRYSKKYVDGSIEIIYECRDRCKTFMIRPDGLKFHIIARRNDNDVLNQEYGWTEKPVGGERDD